MSFNLDDELELATWHCTELERAGFDPDAVAAFGEEDVARLMADARIVRNRRKIDAAVANARAVVALRSDGGLVELVWSYRPEATPEPRTMNEVPTRSPESRALSRTLKDHGFTFVGPTTVYALMEAIGMIDTHLIGSHRRGTSGVWLESGVPNYGLAQEYNALTNPQSAPSTELRNAAC